MIMFNVSTHSNVEAFGSCALICTKPLSAIVLVFGHEYRKRCNLLADSPKCCVNVAQHGLGVGTPDFSTVHSYAHKFLLQGTTFCVIEPPIPILELLLVFRNKLWKFISFTTLEICGQSICAFISTLNDTDFHLPCKAHAGQMHSKLSQHDVCTTDDHQDTVGD